MIRSRFTSVRLASVLLVGLFVFSAGARVHAQPKIATVDLRRIFEGYYKTKQADAQLRERGTDAEKQYAGMLDAWKRTLEPMGVWARSGRLAPVTTAILA